MRQLLSLVMCFTSIQVFGTDVPLRSVNAPYDATAWTPFDDLAKTKSSVEGFVQVPVGPSLIFLPESSDKLALHPDLAKIAQGLRTHPGFACVFDSLRSYPLTGWNTSDGKEAAVWVLASELVGQKSCGELLIFTQFVRQMGTRLKLNPAPRIIPVKSDSPIFHPVGKHTFVIGTALLEELTSESMLAGLLAYGIKMEQYLKKDYAPNLKNKSSTQIISDLQNLALQIPSLRVPPGKEGWADTETTKTLMTYHYHPGGWYSILKILDGYRSKGIAKMQNFDRFLGDLAPRLDRLKRFLDRKGFKTGTFYVGDRAYQDAVKKLGIELVDQNKPKILKTKP